MSIYNEFLNESKSSKKWKAALYIRLSKEDGDKSESNSVTSQRNILTDFVSQQDNMELVDYYIDDGYSGTNFNRPSFQRMMQDIYAKKVNCVIVKDLSRFARNYSAAAYYTDDVFTRLNVRYIALNNCIDSESNNNPATNCITLGLYNVINESYSASNSQNIKSTLDSNRKNGLFIGSFPTYGYLKDPEDHHKLIIDEETAPVVRQIFKWFIEGKSVIGITRLLNASGIPNPSVYKREKGFNYRHSGSNNDGLWCDSTVRRILKNQMYIGNMVQGKNKKVSYKIKQCKPVAEEQWIIVENTHEPIIDKDTFYKAQSLFNRNTRTAPKKSEVDLFSGFVKCADCHRAMSKKTNKHSYGTYEYYRCVTSSKMDKNSCSPHSIRIDKLENTVLATIQMMIDTAVKIDDVLSKMNKSEKNRGEDLLKKALKSAENNRDKTKKMMLDLYPDWKDGVISKEEYLTLKENMAKEVSSWEEKIEEYENKISQYSNGKTAENEFLASFKKYGKIDKLSRALLTELVDSIYVHTNGKITINFKFQDAYQQIVELAESTKQKQFAEIA